MLFDYRKQTELVSLAGIIAWLETKDADEAYNFADCRGACFFSQYMQDRLGLQPDYPSTHGTQFLEDWTKLHGKYRDVAITNRGIEFDPWTFGAALKRARDMQADGIQ